MLNTYEKRKICILIQFEFGLVSTWTASSVGVSMAPAHIICAGRHVTWMSHVSQYVAWRSHVSHLHEACCTCKQVMSHIHNTDFCLVSISAGSGVGVSMAPAHVSVLQPVHVYGAYPLYQSLRRSRLLVRTSHDSSIYVSWLIHMCHDINIHFFFKWRTCLNLSGVLEYWYARVMTHLYMCHDSFIYVPWLIYVCTMTHSNIDHCESWLIHMYAMIPTHVFDLNGARVFTSISRAH